MWATNLHLSILLFVGMSQACSANVWKDFLAKPDDRSRFLALESEASLPDGPCVEFKKQLSSEERQPLFVLVASGNENAFHASMLIMECLDGGDLGDMHRSVGLFMEKSPKTFLSAVAKGRYSDAQLEDMVIKLPLELTDNVDGKIASIQKRINILLAVDEFAIVNIRDKSILILQEYEKELKKYAELENGLQKEGRTHLSTHD
jgi:hypothetical protein